jgi:hypothetical protein
MRYHGVELLGVHFLATGVYVTIYKVSVRTLQETCHVTSKNLNQFVSFGETVACCESPTKHANTFCSQRTEFYYVKELGTYSNHWAIKGQFLLTEIHAMT